VGARTIERVGHLAAGRGLAVAEVPRALDGRGARVLRGEGDRLARHGPLAGDGEVRGRIGERETGGARDRHADAHQGGDGRPPRSVPAHP
jgi:hypothetical protein